jgi:hypothetical protein
LDGWVNVSKFQMAQGILLIFGVGAPLVTLVLFGAVWLLVG